MIVGAFLLLLLAAALAAAELFLPSHGVMGILAILAALGSVVMAYTVAPVLGAIFGVAVILITPVVCFYAIKVYPRSPVGKRVMLAPTVSAAGMFDEESTRLQQLVGQRGVAMTMLRPAGSVEIDGRRVDCVSESEVIYPETTVEVIRVSGLKVIVKPVG